MPPGMPEAKRRMESMAPPAGLCRPFSWSLLLASFMVRSRSGGGSGRRPLFGWWRGLEAPAEAAFSVALGPERGFQHQLVRLSEGLPMLVGARWRFPPRRRPAIGLWIPSAIASHPAYPASGRLMGRAPAVQCERSRRWA